MLTDRERKRLERRRDALIAELGGLGNLMRGTVVETEVRCGRPGCACEQGEKHRKVHLSVNLQGRTRGCYLGREREAVVAPLLAEYERAWRLINDLTAVNLELLRGAGPVTGRAGLPLVPETMRTLGLDQAIADQVQVRERQSGYSEAEKIEAPSSCNLRTPSRVAAAASTGAQNDDSLSALDCARRAFPLFRGVAFLGGHNGHGDRESSKLQ